jgi:dynein heavy chain, axonemal
MFGVEATDYSRINQMARDFQPYSNLWTVLYEWHCKHDSWMNGAWPTIEVEDAERLVEEWIKTLAVCARQFSEKKIVSMQKIAESIRQEVERFRPKVPVLRALKKKGLKTQHLQEISRAIGSELAPDRNFTFTEALELGVLNYSDKIVEIGERASKEYVIEVNLEKMKREWEAISFEVVPYKPTKDKGPEQAQNYVVRSYEAISNKLDEHIVNTQTLQFSPYKRPFEEELAEWDGKLRLMSDVVDEWIKFQQQWMYLQPIFDSPDISKQLPQESKRFRTIDNSWRYNMNQVRA